MVFNMKKSKLSINVHELLTGGPMRLADVERFGTCPHHHAESVAEHSYFVGLYAVLLADWLRIDDVRVIDYAYLYRRVMIHDIEEAVSGDFPRWFKHSTEKVRRTLQDAGGIAFAGLMFSVVPHPAEDCEWGGLYARAWKGSVEHEIEDAILRVADLMSAVAFVYREVMMGNAIIMHVARVGDHVTLFLDDPTLDGFRPILEELDVLVMEMVHATNRMRGKRAK